MRNPRSQPGSILHVFNRGVEKRKIFLAERDMWRFVQGLYLFNDTSKSTNLLYRLEQENNAINFRILHEHLEEKDRKPLVHVMADCLKPNHFHLILEELAEGGISKFIQRLSIGYTKYFNKKYDRVGPLFQGKYKAVRVEDDDQLRYLLVYINVINPGQEIEPQLKRFAQNPENILNFVKEFPWSTHQEYLGTRESVVIDKGKGSEVFPTSASYKNFVRDILSGKQSLYGIDNLTLEA